MPTTSTDPTSREECPACGERTLQPKTLLCSDAECPASEMTDEQAAALIRDGELPEGLASAPDLVVEEVAALAYGGHRDELCDALVAELQRRRTPAEPERPRDNDLRNAAAALWDMHTNAMRVARLIEGLEYVDNEGVPLMERVREIRHHAICAAADITHAMACRDRRNDVDDDNDTRA